MVFSVFVGIGQRQKFLTITILHFSIQGFHRRTYYLAFACSMRTFLLINQWRSVDHQRAQPLLLRRCHYLDPFPAGFLERSFVMAQMLWTGDVEGSSWDRVNLVLSKLRNMNFL